MFATPAAMACQLVEYIDANGNRITPLKPLEEDIASSRLSFVGTVVGFRTYTGDLIEQEIEDCWTEACVALMGQVMSVVFIVEHAIEGTEPGQFYEELYSVGDGDCGPLFSYGSRYIYTTAFAGSELLPDEPTPAQLDYWRSLVRPNPVPVPIDNPTDTGPDCLTRPEDIPAALAPLRAFVINPPWIGPPREIELPRQAFVARIVALRLEDSTLTGDTSPCDDLASPECLAFRERIVSILIDTETIISGEAAIGRRELPIWGQAPENIGCHLPRPGQIYLLGSIYGWGGAAPLRALLASPPDDAQLNQWREAARVGP